MTAAETPTEQPVRLAAIDVGSNSIRLVVAEVTADRRYRIIDEERVTMRLGRGMAECSDLDREIMEQTAETLAHLRTIADGFGVSRIRTVATSAVREADNAGVFLDLVRARAGLEVEVISPDEEARLAYLSAARAFDLSSAPVAIIDIGGGSAELVLSSGPAIESMSSLPLGAVRLTGQFGLGGDVIEEQAYGELRKHIRRTIRHEVGDLPFIPHLVIGTGGTFTNLAGMSMHRGTPASEGTALPFAVGGYELQRSEVKHILHRLRKMTLRERAHVPGLNPQRADIIVAGLTVVDCMLKHLEANRLRVHDQGIRSGILYQMIDQKMGAARQAGAPVVDRMRSVRQFAASCHRDQLHADHVAHLALQLFDGLARELEGCQEHWATAENRDLLLAAALLHDVGYLVSYARHHKHSYHLIMHSPIVGFTRRELEMIANIARYHRGARPKLRHGNFCRMGRRDRDLIRRLAAILRLAVGLDRSHTQSVRDVGVTSCDRVLRVEVRSERDPQVELWGAQRKCRLFEQAFDMEVRLHWQPPAGQGDEAGNGRPAGS